MWSRRDVLRGVLGVAGAVAVDGAIHPASASSGLWLPGVRRPLAGEVAITFDDGPHAVITPLVLDILQRKGVPATWFLVGGGVKANATVVKRIHREGHPVQNHTNSHADLTKLDAAGVRRQLSSCSANIRSVTGVSPTAFRPPYGYTNPTVRSVGAGLGLAQVMWNATPSLTMPSAQFGLNQVMQHVAIAKRNRQGVTVLLHDGSGHQLQMLDLLPRLIDRLRRDGWRFVTIR